MGVLKMNVEVMFAPCPFPDRVHSVSVSLPPGKQAFQEGVAMLYSGSQSIFVLHVNVFQMKGSLIFNVYICLHGT